MRASSLTHKFQTVACLVIVGLFASTTSARSDLLYNGDLTLRQHVESPGWWTDADYAFSPNNNFTGAASLPPIPGAQDKLQRYSLSQTLNLAFTAQNSPWSVSGGFQANGTLTLRSFVGFSGNSPASIPVWRGSQFLGDLPLDVHSGVAGAALSLSWQKTDATTYRWLQLVHTNTPRSPEAEAGSSTVGGGFWYIDNFVANWNSPWYRNTDSNGAYDSTSFTDLPERSFHAGDDWRAYLVLARDAGGNHIEIADNMGIWWGYYDPPTAPAANPVPAPPAAVLAVLGSLLVLFGRYRHERKKPISAC